MSTLIESAAGSIAPPPVPPPLENGDRLTIGEFKRRWERMPKLKRAELIEGVVFMPAALRHTQHGEPHGWIMNLVSTYAMRTGLAFGDNASVELDEHNMPQPDAYVLLPEHLGRRSRIDEEGYLIGPPDFIAEVAASSASLDLHGKLQTYEQSGVQEYIVWRTLDQAFDWFVHQAGALRRQPFPDGIIRCAILPGLWLDTAALIQKNAQQLLGTFEQGLASPEYIAFQAAIGAAAHE
jgi:Uma2 family endonuclease